MKSHGQYCPVAQALELIGDRWTLLVIRELLCGSKRFGDILRGVPKMPRSVLARRLAQLETDGMIERRAGDAGSEYFLTEAGAALEVPILALGHWSRQHAHRPLRDHEIDAGLLMWDMQRSVDAENAPRARTLVRFDFRDPKAGVERYWLKFQDAAADLCLFNPGYPEHLVVSTDARVLTEIWLGHRDFRRSIAHRDVVIEGPEKLAASLPSWFLLNHFVRIERAEAGEAHADPSGAASGES